jgi:hypothetical protein
MVFIQNRTGGVVFIGENESTLFLSNAVMHTQMKQEFAEVEPAAQRPLPLFPTRAHCFSDLKRVY